MYNNPWGIFTCAIFKLGDERDAYTCELREVGLFAVLLVSFVANGRVDFCGGRCRRRCFQFLRTHKLWRMRRRFMRTHKTLHHSTSAVFCGINRRPVVYASTFDRMPAEFAGAEDLSSREWMR